MTVTLTREELALIAEALQARGEQLTTLLSEVHGDLRASARRRWWDARTRCFTLRGRLSGEAARHGKRPS